MATNTVSGALAAFLLLASTTLHAQQLYVADKLVLNVYAAADQSSDRVATIETGDIVDEIERADNFVHVRLSDGREGWVGSNYLTAQPPAIVRLKELQAGQAPAAPASAPKQLTDDLARLQKQNAALTAEVADLKKKAAASAAAAAPAAASAPATPAAHEIQTPEPEVAPAPVVVVNRSYWWAWILAVIAASIGGFVVGYQTLGRRVRERFGGVKVY